jgi:hypothetical protein
MDQLLNFIVMFVPAGLVLANSMFESKQRSQQLEDHMKHNHFMLQMTVREILSHIALQNDVIKGLEEKVNATR